MSVGEGPSRTQPNQTCRYYPKGGRAWKQVNGVTTLYLELDGIEWGSYEPAGTLKERTIRASGTGGAVVAVHAPTGGLIRLLPNRQGSVIGWLRPDGKLGGAYTYDAYGNSPQAGPRGRPSAMPGCGLMLKQGCTIRRSGHTIPLTGGGCSSIRRGWSMG